MRAPRWFLVSLAIAGCASAGKGNSIIGGITDAGGDPGRRSDANDFPELDASPIDAPAEQLTLTQNVSSTVTRATTFLCLNPNDRTLTVQNSFYRVFALDDFHVTSVFHVTQVDFAIEFANAGPDAMEQPAQVTLASYGAVPAGTTLDAAKIRPITTVDLKIPNGAGTRMSVPIAADVAPGSQLLVELAVPDGTPTGSAFVIGSNSQGERGPGYLSSTDPGCALPDPTTMESIREAHPDLMLSEADILLTVTGTR
ncbi:MAG TPA: hypothetical protein VFK02_25045 [Kofleriaceae bacterium]|nr:hypothetical protein [Kofleriaceae bacterium]